MGGGLDLQTALTSRLPWSERGWLCSEFPPTCSSPRNSQLIYFSLYYFYTVPQIFKFMDELGSSLLNIDSHCPVLYPPPTPRKTLESFFSSLTTKTFFVLFCHLFHL